MSELAPFPAPTLPTPLVACPALSTAHAELWIKNDGLSHPVYGGNKVRKLERALADARARGATRLLTFGAAGSHHVLTTAIFARAHGLRAAAVLAPQHATPHAEETLRAALAQGLEAIPVDALTFATRAARAWKRRTDYVIPPGGSSVSGTLAYLDAVTELRQQLEERGLDPPDVIVVPVGSGGTSAGLVAGVLANALPARVAGVLVVRNALARLMVEGLARAALRRKGLPGAGRLPLTLDASEVGAGYGVPTRAGETATEVAASVGLTLDPTYTAKAFAKALSLLSAARSANGRKLRVLYWHTLSQTPLARLRGDAPLPPELSALFDARPGSPARPRGSP